MSVRTPDAMTATTVGSRRFTVLLTPELEDGGYSVAVPALPGCHTQGETLDEALANAREAIRLYLDDVTAAGEPIPEERAHPELAEVEV
jgi:antitoxin HicB